MCSKYSSCIFLCVLYNPAVNGEGLALCISQVSSVSHYSQLDSRISKRRERLVPTVHTQKGLKVTRRKGAMPSIGSPGTLGKGRISASGATLTNPPPCLLGIKQAELPQSGPVIPKRLQVKRPPPLFRTLKCSVGSPIRNKTFPRETKPQLAFLYNIPERPDPKSHFSQLRLSTKLFMMLINEVKSKVLPLKIHISEFSLSSLHCQ